MSQPVKVPVVEVVSSTEETIGPKFPQLPKRVVQSKFNIYVFIIYY